MSIIRNHIWLENKLGLAVLLEFSSFTSIPKELCGVMLESFISGFAFLNMSVSLAIKSYYSFSLYLKLKVQT